MAPGKRRANAAKGSSVTSFAVAEAAGVSQSTVSLVMSGKAAGRVSKATRLLVEETARRLGYQPNASAQMLRTGSLKTLSLAVPNVEQPFFGQVLVRAELTARENGYSVLLIDTSSDTRWCERLVRMIRGRLIAGCIVYAGDVAAERLLRPVRDHILYVEADDVARSGVDLNVAAAMRMVVEHLAGLGHRRIGYFAADYAKGAFRRRFRYFLDEVERAGLAFDPRWQARSTFGLDPATENAVGLLRSGDFTAVFCDDDLLAAATYRAARQLGRIIPDDLSVVGFNDVELARILWPELTTVAIPTEKVARSSVERMIATLQGDETDDDGPDIVDLLLRVRGSTGPAPA
ncbi:MAG: LacI family transcriptional regulator [Alphaproteobacteria bacterium]|nr:MAG: LacI family transcriptional regulator [Alphaproteobacteria bacterium]